MGDGLRFPSWRVPCLLLCLRLWSSDFGMCTPFKWYPFHTLVSNEAWGLKQVWGLKEVSEFVEVQAIIVLCSNKGRKWAIENVCTHL